MAYAQLTPSQANYLKLARALSDADRIAVKAELFRTVKASFGIPDDHKLKVEIDDAAHPNYLVLIRKKNDEPYALRVSDGKWVGAGAPQGTVSNPPAPVVRWFAVDNAEVYEATLSLLRNEEPDWEDGDLTAPDDLKYVPGTNGRLAFDEYGNVWAAAEEADL